MSFALLALGAVGLVAAQASETPKLTAECVDTLIFFARGNDAPYHDGRTTPFLDATCAKLVAEGKTCDYMDVKYDTTVGGPYCTQVGEGDANGIAQITAYQAQCPCAHIVLGGYSQGANVMGDVLSGGGCSDGSLGIDPTSAAGKAIAAAVVWGDPRHVADQSYNVLDGASLQGTPRDADSLARLQAYASVLRNYCGAGDPICAGGDNVTQHLDYFDLYVDDAATWVVGKVDAAGDLCDAAASSTAGPKSTSAAVSVATPSVIKPTAIASASASSVIIPVIVNPTSVSSVIAVPVTINTTSIAIPIGTAIPTVANSSIPIYSNSTAAASSIATPAPHLTETSIVYPTTIRTVLTPITPVAGGGYAHADPTTILSVVSITSTLHVSVTQASAPGYESAAAEGCKAVTTTIYL